MHTHVNTFSLSVYHSVSVSCSFSLIYQGFSLFQAMMGQTACHKRKWEVNFLKGRAKVTQLRHITSSISNVKKLEAFKFWTDTSDSKCAEDAEHQAMHERSCLTCLFLATPVSSSQSVFVKHLSFDWRPRVSTEKLWFSSSPLFPAISLGFNISGEHFCVSDNFFHPTIDVVTFPLHRWCALGVFLFLAFTHLGHECQDLLSSYDGMHVCPDWISVYTLIRKSL